MPTISAIPDSPQFNIKAVCEQTGILPVTLRAWERRYQLLKPQRSTGNYRLYSERDVAILRWLKSRVDAGLPIRQAAAELRTIRSTGQWPETFPALEKELAAGESPAVLAENLYAKLIGLDEAGATAVLREAHALFDLTTICQAVIAPCLVAIGDAWHRGEVRIVQEHFATNYLRGRLLALFQAYPTERSGARIMVGCAPNELHEIGALMLALFLRRAGLRVEYLGADLEVRDLVDYVRLERPALVCLSANSAQTATDLRYVHQGLANLRPRPKFGFGGRAFNADPALRQATPGMFLGENAALAVQTVRQLLKS